MSPVGVGVGDGDSSVVDEPASDELAPPLVRLLPGSQRSVSIQVRCT